MHIGMIGGIGPASTVAYYQRLSAAVRDTGGALDLTIVNADVNELLRDNEAGYKNAQGAEAIVLADTDLNLAFDGRDVGYNVIDALDVHVTLLTDHAVGRAYLNEHKAGLS
ncbi:hypothetical protein N9P29_01145 [bacterium]|nr:hypothetical protein [bacterium]